MDLYSVDFTDCINELLISEHNVPLERSPLHMVEASRLVNNILRHLGHRLCIKDARQARHVLNTHLKIYI